MAYEYAASEAERAAAELLRERGWHVTEPSCPLCHGYGWLSWIQPFETATGRALPGSWIAGNATTMTKPCPNGCPIPTSYYLASAPVTADGTVGMRRGVS